MAYQRLCRQNVVTVSTVVHEGDIFTDANAISTNNITLEDYITQLFPRLRARDVSRAVVLYENLAENVPAQAALVMGES